MNNLNLSPEAIVNMSPNELKNLAEYLKKIYNIPEKNDLSIKLIDQIDSYEHIVKQNWIKSIKEMPNYISKGKPTLPESSMNLAGEIIGNYLSICTRLGKITKPLKIIEPLAGNGIASNIIFKIIKSKIPEISYIASDIQNLNDKVDLNSYDVEFGIDCVDSIIKHQEHAEILILACPPPYSFDPKTEQEPIGFVDYFAIKKWTELNKKILIYIGEMGFSDGTSGMYDFMMNHPIWKLKFKKSIIEKEDIFGRLIKKEIYIFENSLFE